MTYLRTPHAPVTPTPAMLRYWWLRLNRDMFHGALPQPVFRVRRLKDDRALYENAVYGNLGEGTISFAPAAITRRALVGTMLHEMIHQLQMMQSRPLVHGRFFNVVAKRLGRRAGVLVP